MHVTSGARFLGSSDEVSGPYQSAVVGRTSLACHTRRGQPRGRSAPGIVQPSQNEPDTVSRHPTIVYPRYMVSTTKLIGASYTLQSVKSVIIIDAECMNRDHEQAKKRINCKVR